MSDLDLTSTPGQPRLAETIMPDLVWEKALNFLKDPEDILNAGKTCTLFQRLLHSKMVAVNLVKTLPYMMKMNYLDDKDILKCRTVSKGWRDVVDNFFESHFLRRIMLKRAEGLDAFPVARYFTCALYDFSNKLGRRRTDLERFMATMRDHPRNPFIGRAVYFKLDCSETEREHYLENFRSLYDFFEIFGEHIWTFHFEIDNYGRREWRDHLLANREFIGSLFSFIMRDVFLLAPNLKSFLIQAYMDMPVTMNVNELNALAPPPALEKLQLRGSSAFKNAVIQRHCNTQLKTLFTSFYLEERFPRLSWPNLKEFHTEISHAGYGNDVELNDVLDFSAPQLELLDLKIDFSDAYCPIANQEVLSLQFRALLTALQNLSNTSPNLRTLHFCCEYLFGKIEDLDFPEDLQCPESIKTLQISEKKMNCFDSGPVDYSFLLRFPHIENIHIKPEDDCYITEEFEDETVEVQKFVRSERMYESNIWKLLPSLKVFSYGNRIYTRSSYERRCPTLENLKI